MFFSVGQILMRFTVFGVRFVVRMKKIIDNVFEVPILLSETALHAGFLFGTLGFTEYKEPIFNEAQQVAGGCEAHRAPHDVCQQRHVATVAAVNLECIGGVIIKHSSRRARTLAIALCGRLTGPRSTLPLNGNFSE